MCTGFDEAIKGQVELSGGTQVTVEVLDEPAAAEPFIIEIDGITSAIDEETLELYFTNSKKSKGGEIKEDSIRIEQTKAYLTFIDPKGAICVLS